MLSHPILQAKKPLLLTLLLSLASLLLIPIRTHAAPQKSIEVGIKLIKTKEYSETLPYEVRFPANCPSCKLRSGEDRTGQNPREIYFHVDIPKEVKVLENLTITVNPNAVKEVIVQKDRLLFERSTNSIQFNLPVPSSKATTAELHTHLETPGVDIRIEHAYEDRRACKYAAGRFPHLEVQAALNLEFGLREAILILGLDKDVVSEKLGTILLMGFDTNCPRGHIDYPPHMHMHLMWPDSSGTQVGHFYINEAGLLTYNRVSILGIWDWPKRIMGRGRRFTTWDQKGQTIFVQTVTPEGWFHLERSRGGKCLLQPNGAGFHQGTIVQCGTHSPRKIKVQDDVMLGELRVWVDDKAPEVYRYDIDTAVLLQ